MVMQLARHCCRCDCILGSEQGLRLARGVRVASARALWVLPSDALSFNWVAADGKKGRIGVAMRRVDWWKRTLT
jgi:hypothetical protein